MQWQKHPSFCFRCIRSIKYLFQENYGWQKLQRVVNQIFRNLLPSSKTQCYVITGYFTIGWYIFLGMLCFVGILTLIGLVYMIRNNCRCKVQQRKDTIRNSYWDLCINHPRSSAAPSARMMRRRTWTWTTGPTTTKTGEEKQMSLRCSFVTIMIYSAESTPSLGKRPESWVWRLWLHGEWHGHKSHT